jgi:hypothetical protein
MKLLLVSIAQEMEFEICLPFVKIDDFFMLRAEALFLP